MTYISVNLRYLRKLTNLSQQAFAEKVGLNRGNIASYEKGSAEPSLTNLLKISRYLNIDLVDFIDKDLSKKPQSISAPVNRLDQTPSVHIEAGRQDNGFRKLDDLRLGDHKLDTLIQQSLDLEKIVDGLQRYHDLKFSQVDGADRTTQLLLLDYGRMVEVANDVLGINRQLIYQLREKWQDPNGETVLVEEVAPVEESRE